MTIRTYLGGIGLVMSLLVTASAMGRGIGISTLQIDDTANGRTLTGVVWYPTSSTEKPTLIDDNPVFSGVSAVENAVIADHAYPLVVISHGLGGNVRNQNWLAAHLADRGMIVVAINHPGSTTGNIDSKSVLEIWHRPADISVVITALLNMKPYGAHIDRQHIIVIGHSLGAYTALAMAGVRVDQAKLVDFCTVNPQTMACAYFHPDDIRSISRETFEQANPDSRVTQIIALSPAFAAMYRTDSLRDIAIPTLVITGDQDSVVPVANVRTMKEELPARTVYAEISQAGHFSFLPVCKPEGSAILEEEKDDPVCDDQKDRMALHNDILRHIDNFLFLGN